MTASTDSVATTAHQMASRALDWLAEHHQLGALNLETTVDMPRPDETYKPLGETALCASLTLREGVAGPNEAETAQRLLDFAWEELREGDLLYARQLRHPMLTDPLELYAHFARAGYRHAKLDALLRHLLRLRSPRVAEVLPSRQLAVASAARIVGIDDQRNWAELTAFTWLGATPEPWAMDWMAAYNVTHTVFHLTDWGADRDGLPPHIQEYLATWLPAWVETWREVGQWDLIAELLLTDNCLPEPVCGAESWERLAAVQHEDGMLPRDDEPLPDDPAEVYRMHHHPTVVAVAAGTIALSRALGAAA